ncbi:Fur family transcriptional regulator [Blastococcus goldschmidtiae]|uniref:Fur family transcriptional regulator n=1 Tax=Blastococcus goldschmidtiae TaxID=3075546 RepID=A0ABU2K4Z9_9ACTN|nr:Fur family transcriptional regulator [Blastococcus sp. DSM 46792]MDT0275287.1 Fur family transcriptional regulator [Blastococcus sp. DSM 46792]
METTWAPRLREAGLRVTRPRLAVLDVLSAQPHADALVTGGLARRIEPAGAPALFELRVGDNHHHPVCRSCGAVADVDCAVGGAPCLTPSDATGFVVDAAEVVFWGSCRACQGGAAAGAVQSEAQDIRGGTPA